MLGTNLDYLHESGKVELGVESEVMNVGNECGDFFFKFVKLLLKGVYAVSIIVVVVRTEIARLDGLFIGMVGFVVRDVIRN